VPAPPGQVMVNSTVTPAIPIRFRSGCRRRPCRHRRIVVPDEVAEGRRRAVVAEVDGDDVLPGERDLVRIALAGAVAGLRLAPKECHRPRRTLASSVTST